MPNHDYGLVFLEWVNLRMWMDLGGLMHES